MKEWLVVFDVLSEPFRWGNAGEGLAAIAIVALGIAAAMALRKRQARGATAALALTAGVAVYFAVRTIDHRREHEACAEAERRGDGRVLEGVVSGFHAATSAMPWSRPESFVVEGETVEYPVLAEGCGFHRTTSVGPIRNGLRVRLRTWKGQILKLEIERDRAAAEQPPG